MNISEPNYKILFSMTDDNSIRLNKQFLLFGEVRCASRKNSRKKKLMLVPHFKSFGFFFFFWLARRISPKRRDCS